MQIIKMLKTGKIPFFHRVFPVFSIGLYTYCGVCTAYCRNFTMLSTINYLNLDD